MNLKRIHTICLLISSFLILSCKQTTQFSEFRELEIEGRNVGIYLPAGYSEKIEYPVIYMEDGLVFKDCNFKYVLDSLVFYEMISPVVVVCSYENKMKVPGTDIAFRNAEYIEALARTDSRLMELYENHYRYFNEALIPYIEKNFNVSSNRSERIYFGTSNSADFGLTLSFRNPALFSEYWCYSPVYSDVSPYGYLSEDVKYGICWGTLEEIGQFNYFPELLKDIRKRGGKVNSWTFDGGHDRKWWKYWFFEELKRRFPYN